MNETTPQQPQYEQHATGLFTDLAMEAHRRPGHEQAPQGVQEHVGHTITAQAVEGGHPVADDAYAAQFMGLSTEHFTHTRIRERQ